MLHFLWHIVYCLLPIKQYVIITPPPLNNSDFATIDIMYVCIYNVKTNILIMKYVNNRSTMDKYPIRFEMYFKVD